MVARLLVGQRVQAAARHLQHRRRRDCVQVLHLRRAARTGFASHEADAREQGSRGCLCVQAALRACTCQCVAGKCNALAVADASADVK